MKHEQQPIYAATYCRYSSHGQTEQSIEGQLRDNYDFAQREGYTIVAEYIDRARTGRSDNRDDFQRMIADAAKRGFSVVIVWKLDRFARNRYDSAIYKAQLKRYGVKVVSVKESITDSPEGIILEGLLESMAEYYSANLAQNIRRGQRESIAKGKFCGGTVPYGYKAMDGRLVIDEKTAPYVRYIFDQYAKGVSKKEIIDAVNEKGMRTRRGGPITHNSLAIMLKNTTYIGQFKYTGQIVPGLADQLIDVDTFTRVQEQLRIHAHAPAASTAKVEYLLSGKAYCGLCGAAMIGVCGRSKTGAMYYYYQCGNRNRRQGCKKRNERKDFVEWYVVEQTMQYILSPHRAARIAKAVVAEYKKEFSGSRIDELEKALDQIDRELDKLVDALIETPKVAHGKIHARMETLGDQKADLEANLARLRVACDIKITEPEVLAWLHQFNNGDPMDEDFRRRIIDVFINSVYLYDDKIIIFYNIRGGKQVSYIDVANAIDESDTAPDASESSSFVRSAPPRQSKLEPKIFFVNGILGIIIPRGKS